MNPRLPLVAALVYSALAATGLGACGGSEESSSSKRTGEPGGSAGTAGNGGNADSGLSGTGGSGGTASAMVRNPRSCGLGAPCTAGANCSLSGIESSVNCECDETGHFFCDAHAGGGAPPIAPCPGQCDSSGQGYGYANGRCSLTNGYCTRTCSCEGACTTDCSGSGPASGPMTLCDLSLCDEGSYYRFGGGCSIKDGTCEYSVSCTDPPGFVVNPKISGHCD